MVATSSVRCEPSSLATLVKARARSRRECVVRAVMHPTVVDSIRQVVRVGLRELCVTSLYPGMVVRAVAPAA